MQECAHRFPVPLYGNDGRKMDKFVLTVPQDQLTCVVTLTGDSITHAVCLVNLNQFVYNRLTKMGNTKFFWKIYWFKVLIFTNV